MSLETSLTLIGSGNLAWHLAPGLEKSGFHISEVYSRDITKARLLAAKLKYANAIDNLDLSASPSSVIILAIPDKSIETVANKIKTAEDTIVVHTSGTTSISVLDKFKNHGVFYPLQTFSKDKPVDFSPIPVLIEASNEFAGNCLHSIAQSLSKKVFNLSSEKRIQLHLAAVFACNFNNHLLSIAKGILDKNALPLDIIEPLVKETVSKAFEIGPENAQTGPAARSDYKTIDKHVEMLANYPDLKQIYIKMSENILNLNK